MRHFYSRREVAHGAFGTLGKGAPLAAECARTTSRLHEAMAYREFTDDRGREWRVWDVYPTLAERRLRSAAAPPGGRERRRSAERRLNIHPDMAHGWLTFESRDGERRRLAPIPKVDGGWSTASEHELNAWCAAAAPAPQARRLIE